MILKLLPIDIDLAWQSLPAFLRGLEVTALITGSVLVLGLALSLPVALACTSRSPLLRYLGSSFVVFFRGTPTLILLYLIYYGFAQISAIRDSWLWIIFGNAFACAVIGLTLNHAAYLAEILRGSLNTVPIGFIEAAKALGLSPFQTFTFIRLPIAVRYGFKAYQNEVVLFAKGTAVVSVITVTDLTAVANGIFERTFDPFTPLLTAAAFYWLFVNAVRLVLGRFERRLNRHVLVSAVRQRSPRKPRLSPTAGVSSAR
jgi:His/Glu/Gln/Arg/opine family amino acid ABC transporter permease subunit